VLPTEQQGLIAFFVTSDLSAAQVTGHKEITIHSRVARWTYEFGKSIVPREVVPELPTQIRIKYEDYFHGEDVIWLNFEQLYQLYHHDVLDISFVSTWLL
jgi:hypothetical protein